MARGRHLWGQGVAVAALYCALSSAAPASDDADNEWYNGTTAEAGARRETWAHAFARGKSWSLTNGTTWSPVTTLQQDGIRLRLVGGLTHYRYTSRQYDAFTPSGTLVEHMGLKRTLDVMAGYQWSSGPLTLKAFVGMHGTVTMFRTHDPELPGKLKAYGPKGVVEAWTNLGDRFWASADLNYTTVERTFGARARLGWQPLPSLSLGPEAHLLSSRETDSTVQRIGAFVRFDNGVHEISAAAGFDRTSGQKTAPYASLQYMYRY